MHATRIELDALADPIRSRPEDDDFAARGGIRFVLALIRRIEIRRAGLEFRRARVDALVNGTDSGAMSLFADLAFGAIGELCDVVIGEAIALEICHPERSEGSPARSRRGSFAVFAAQDDKSLHLHDLAHLAQKPRIDRRERIDLFDGHPRAKGVADGEDAVRAGNTEKIRQLVGRCPSRLQTVHPDFQRPQSFLQRLVERAADGHRFADRLHREAEDRRRVAEFLEGEPRNLHHHVIDRRLE